MVAKKVFKFFGLVIPRLNLIERWSLLFSTKKENVKEHSFDVAIIAQNLVAIDARMFNGHLDAAQAAVFGLYHDMAEIFTGDLPTPVKHFCKEVKEAADSLEQLAINKLVSCHPIEVQDIYRSALQPPAEYHRFIKAADRLSAIIKCRLEIARGNKEFIPAHTRQMEEIEKMAATMPSVRHFIDNYLPAVELSYDALCGGNGSALIDSDEN